MNYYSQKCFVTAGIEEGSKWSGFKLIGDNVDKCFKASFQRVDRGNHSIHYFNSYALLDRIDFSGLSNDAKSGEIDVHELLPNIADMTTMKSCFEILVSRYMHCNMQKMSQW